MMAEARAIPAAVSLSTLIPGPEFEDALNRIDAAGGVWFGKTEAASLGDFCRKAVEGLQNFVRNIGSIQDFKILRADGPEELKRALRNAIVYIDQKCSVSGFAKLAAIEAMGGQSLASTEMDVRNTVTEAVRLHVEVVVEAAKRNMEEANRQGRPIAMARHRATAVQVWHEISALNIRTEFGFKFMNGYREELAESGTLNDVWRVLQESMNVQSCLVRKLDYIQKEVDAGRLFHEKDCCPEIFFLVPADTSSCSALDRFERWKIFTQDMHLFFMCTSFFDEIHASMATQPAREQKQFPGECSECIDIRQPSDFFAKYNQAIKLSILVIQTIGIAAAFFGLSVQGVLPSNISNISDLDVLSDAMNQGLEAAEEAFTAADESPMTPEERPPSTAPGPWRRLKLRMRRQKSVPSAPPPAVAASRTRDDPAHLVVQHYLSSNGVEWKKSVQCKLKLAHNSYHGYTYVCQNNPQHETKWALRNEGHARSPMG